MICLKECDFWKWISADFWALAGFLWGGLDGLLTALLVFMVLDYLTGIASSLKMHKKLSSEVGFWGIVKKCMILALVTVAHFLDSHVLGGGSSMFRSGVVGFFLANEGLSILENAGNLGVPLPEFLKKALEQLKDSSDRSDEDDEN